MAAYEEDPEDEFGLSDWKEAIDSGAFPSTGHFSNDMQEVVRVGYIPGNMTRSALRFFLQYAETDGVGKMTRSNPHRDPQYPWLYAYDVTFTPFVPKANTDNPNNEPYVTSPWDFDGIFPRSEKVIATVRYKAFRCPFVEDEDIGEEADEWKRNAYFESASEVASLSVTGGISQLAFAETDTGGPTVGTKFAAPLAELQTKTRITMHWLSVPWPYLSQDLDIFFPQKIIDCAGKVNSAAFLGCAAGTVFMEAPQWSVKPFPVADSDGNPQWAVDLAVPFVYFDPEKGKAASSYRGHNLMPWSGDGTDGGDGKYYLATRDGLTTGRKLIQEADFYTIFENWTT